MKTQPRSRAEAATGERRWSTLEMGALVWILLALAASGLVTVYLRTAVPILTVIWLAVPLVALLVTRDAAQIGIRRVAWRTFLSTLGLNIAFLWALMIAVEPWSHVYRRLVDEAVQTQGDATFAWLTRFQGAPAWAGLFFFSGLVTLFGEELFFRGWLQLLLMKRMPPLAVIPVQAALFTIPQILVVVIFSPLESVLWTVVYSWLGIGVIGGWAAWRTRSIWPSLVTATLTNFLLTWLILRTPLL